MHAAIGFGLVVTVALAALEYGLGPTFAVSPRGASSAPSPIMSAAGIEYTRLPVSEPADDHDSLSWIARTVAVAEAQVAPASSAIAAVPVPAPYPDRSSARQPGFSTPAVALLDVTAPSSGLPAKPVTAPNPGSGGKIERMASVPPADIAVASKSVTTHSPDIAKAGIAKAGRSKPTAAKSSKGGPNKALGTVKPGNIGPLRPAATNPPKVKAAARPIKPASDTSAATALTVLRSDPVSTQVSIVKPKLPLR